ncbi:septum formation initiator family protein [Syntrophotalea carbinolica DSM 2380]|uniref:Septum formation initiator family protein n=1 Tax=Syntrophotalea carbinolica (strain DSM 2380 / NBRC 103641 / GraBd1) TaxID=338963 RepID=Q3A6K7_SYNC1|nr:septum formation initiator family protein [Syntrophotalea carbinolica]ABA88000.1 septum formation initiator family protein [Syntrophotalea carbinolica DSM 2380]
MANSKPTARVRSLGQRIPLVPVVIILLVLGAGLFGEKGALRMLQARRQKMDLERQVAAKQNINRELKQEIKQLKTDRIYIETLARKELGMVGDGEVVYQFPTESNPSDHVGPATSSAP